MKITDPTPFFTVLGYNRTDGTAYGYHKGDLSALTNIDLPSTSPTPYNLELTFTDTCADTVARIIPAEDLYILASNHPNGETEDEKYKSYIHSNHYTQEIALSSDCTIRQINPSEIPTGTIHKDLIPPQGIPQSQKDYAQPPASYHDAIRHPDDLITNWIIPALLSASVKEVLTVAGGTLTVLDERPAQRGRALHYRWTHPAYPTWATIEHWVTIHQGKQMLSPAQLEERMFTEYGYRVIGTDPNTGQLYGYTEEGQLTTLPDPTPLAYKNLPRIPYSTPITGTEHLALCLARTNPNNIITPIPSHNIPPGAIPQNTWNILQISGKIPETFPVPIQEPEDGDTGSHTPPAPLINHGIIPALRSYMLSKWGGSTTHPVMGGTLTILEETVDSISYTWESHGVPTWVNHLWAYATTHGELTNWYDHTP